MKINIQDLNIVNLGLGELMEIKIKGSLKFKILKNKMKAEEVLQLAVESLKEASKEEEKELLELEQEVELEKLTYDELEELEITPKTLLMLEKIMEDNIND